MDYALSHINKATEHLRDHGYPGVTWESVAGVADRGPLWLKGRENGWQQLVRLYVEHPEWR